MISKMYMKHDRLNRAVSEYKQTYLTTYLQKYEYLLDNCLILKMLYLSLTKQRELNINDTQSLWHIFKKFHQYHFPFFRGVKEESSKLLNFVFFVSFFFDIFFSTDKLLLDEMSEVQLLTFFSFHFLLSFQQIDPSSLP